MKELFFYRSPSKPREILREECERGLIFDGHLGVPRPLTEVERLVHRLRGNLPVYLPPEDYVQPPPFAGGPPTEVI
jgi:hypothetical protein